MEKRWKVDKRMYGWINRKNKDGFKEMKTKGWINRKKDDGWEKERRIDGYKKKDEWIN